MLNWKKIVASVLLLCAVPGYLCAHEQSRLAEQKLLKKIMYYLQNNQIREMKTYWENLPVCPGFMIKKKDLPEICIGSEMYIQIESDTHPGMVVEENYPLNNVRDPYGVLTVALTQHYTNMFHQTPFYFDAKAFQTFHKKYKDTWLKSYVEAVMMEGDGGWLRDYFAPRNAVNKESKWGQGLYIRAYLRKHLGISTYGLLKESAVRYPNLVYFDLRTEQLKSIIDGLWSMSREVGDGNLFHQVKQNIFFNYLDYDMYEQEVLTKEFAHTMQLLGAEKDDAWNVLEITPITKKMQENAVKLYSKCYSEGLNKTLCENFQKHAKKHGVWMKIKVPPIPTPERRSTSIL